MHFKSTTWPLRMLERAAEILENAIDSVYNDEKLNVEEKETLAKRKQDQQRQHELEIARQLGGHPQAGALVGLG